jgi:UDP-N-acetylglucosamine transferase subunit ALG13
MSTFVTVGTAHDPFPRLLAEVDRLAAAEVLPRPVLVQHGYTRFASDHCQAKAFIDRAEFEQHLTEAQLVITHAGTTVLDAIRAGKVPVIMPRLARYGEHIDDHQLQLAEVIARQHHIALAAEPADLQTAVQTALALQQIARDCQRERLESPLVSEIRALLLSLQSREQPYQP